MAGILTHISMARIEKPDSDMFALGSFLPDIGYLGVIQRRETHLDPERGDSPAERARVLQCLDENTSKSITDGFIFHSLTEHSWDEGVFVQSSSRWMGKAIKLWADEIAWDLLQGSIDSILAAFQHARDNRFLSTFRHLTPHVSLT